MPCRIAEARASREQGDRFAANAYCRFRNRTASHSKCRSRRTAVAEGLNDWVDEGTPICSICIIALANRCPRQYRANQRTASKLKSARASGMLAVMTQLVEAAYLAVPTATLAASVNPNVAYTTGTFPALAFAWPCLRFQEKPA